MYRLATVLLSAGLLISQCVEAVDVAPQMPPRPLSRLLSLAEQGHTDRIIVIWKSDTAKRAAQAARAGALPATGKAAAQAAIATRMRDADPDRPQRLERIRHLAASAATHQKHPFTLTPHRRMGDGAEVMRLPTRVSPDEIATLRQQLLADPEVADVIPDRLYFPQLTPSDPRYTNGEQWALNGPNGISAPAAWDITTGNPNLVIGVIDTGMLPHNELAGRWTGGYDFVSLAERSNDGDLRENDPTDPGDWVTLAETTTMGGPLFGCPVTDSRWHGTAMAGIIAANTNNGTGIAGINWNSKILPVRVVGRCGGYESDIADGIRWAVGLSVPGVTANPSPAKVVNVSLASAGACSTLLQGAITDAITANVPVIAAAGNQSADAMSYSPGNCANVITVAATDKNGGKPIYTNFGSGVALAAPC